MELLLVQVFALLRPVLYLELDVTVGGLHIFELAALAFVSMLIVALAVRSTLSKNIEISAIDVSIVLFSIWCVGVYLAYIEKAEARDLVRLLAPFLTYTAIKNIIIDVQAYRAVLKWMLVGFVVPVVASGAVIAMGGGVYGINYWTGVARYEGLYTGPHNLAHNVAFFLMALAIYYRLTVETGGPEWRQGTGTRLFWGAVAAIAVFCLYKSATRTAILGLGVFCLFYFYVFNRKMLLVGALSTVLLAALFTSALSNILFDLEKVSEGDWETEELGSGRLGRWHDQLQVFASLSLDAQMAGVGIGNKVNRFALEEGQAASTDSHNDFLEVLVQTGAVGFLLFLSIQWFLLLAILKVSGRERYAFLALFVAVGVMNFVSNSYVSRFGMGQMFYLVMAYAEVARRGRVRAGSLQPPLGAFGR